MSMQTVQLFHDDANSSTNEDEGNIPSRLPLFLSTEQTFDDRNMTRTYTSRRH